MNASVQVVTAKCVLRYIQAPTSSSQPEPIAHDCSAGSAEEVIELMKSVA